MPTRWRVSLALAAAMLAGAALLDRAYPVDLSRYRNRSVEMLDAAGRPLNIALAADGMWRLSVEPDAVCPHYLELLLAREDRRFWWHPGVDPLSLARAFGQLVTHRRIVSGGSTLTMQTARLLSPHAHTVAGKLVDILRAFQLEAHLSKRDILAIYLTLAPFGGNIEGVRAASLIYFEREPSALTNAQAAFLVALPQNPERLRPDRHGLRAARAGDRLLAKFRPKDVARLGAVSRHPLPAHAPHLAAHLGADADGEVVRTSLDLNLQRAIEELARREQRWIVDEANLAALVVRNRDHSVTAYLGGADYFARGGMIDMVRAQRSPGSALKPFIYGLAFDDGAVLPDTLIDDAPARIGDYAPQNFDRAFHGVVTVREALQQSYNLPAVALLDEVGPGRLAATLRQAGARLSLPPGASEPGLPLALGGVGISLADLTMLYAALADGGRALPLRVLADDTPGEAVPLMTETAARLVGDILRGTPLPDGLASAGQRRIAYKTGTSFGFRDAWAVGYSGAYTVGVWVGRVEGTPRPGAFGRNTAAPLLFKVFSLLPADAEAPLPAPAADGAELTPSLRHYLPRGAATLASDGAAPLAITFPPARAFFEHAAAAPKPIALEASGGAPPYRWAIDGVPLPVPPIGAASAWQPDGPGFFRLSVIDREGRAASENVRVK